MNRIVLFVAIASLLAMAVVPGARALADTTIEKPSGLRIIETDPGNGPEARAGQTVVVHYTGWLYAVGDQRGQKFDSSVDRGKPFSFVLGAGDVIPGWDEGVAGMKVGAKRTLIVPPDLAYGEKGAPGAIPPNATLIFDVELLDVK